VSAESIDQCSRIGVPNFAGSIIAGRSEVISVFAEAAISQWLFMCGKSQVLFIVSVLRLIVISYLCILCQLLYTAFVTCFLKGVRTLGSCGRRTLSTYSSMLELDRRGVTP
jgi:hypothetical protein